MNYIDFFKAQFPKGRFLKNKNIENNKYTGLKDSLKKRIYNNDIIKVHSLDFCVYFKVEVCTNKDKVYFTNKNCRIHICNFIKTFDTNIDKNLKIEVLGKYKNIEKLKDKEFNFYISKEI